MTSFASAVSHQQLSDIFGLQQDKKIRKKEANKEIASQI